MVRDIGGGKYEFVNASAVPRELVTARDIGLEIKKNKNRLKFLKECAENWTSVGEKVELAARNAGKSPVFPTSN